MMDKESLIEAISASITKYSAFNNMISDMREGVLGCNFLSSMREVIFKRVVRKTPGNKLAEPQGIAGLVKFCFGDDFELITGETVSINGGQYLS